MDKYVVKTMIVCLCLVVCFGCTDPDFLKGVNETGLQEGEIIEFQGEKIKVGDLSDEDISNGITRSVSSVSINENEHTRGAPAGPRYLTIIIRDGAMNAGDIRLNLEYMRQLYHQFSLLFHGEILLIEQLVCSDFHM